MSKIAFVGVVATVLWMDWLCATQGMFANQMQVSATDSSFHFNVLNYGAKGDGVTDDSQAFNAAWAAACKAQFTSVLEVPSGKKFLLNPITFSGPCGSPIVMEIAGTIVAPSQQSAWNHSDNLFWLLFIHVSELTLEGGGIIDGQGSVWWETSCKVHKQNPCVQAPTAMSIIGCTNVSLSNVQFMNGQGFHVAFVDCSGVEVNGLTVQSPEDSPNTDGIHLQRTKDVHLNNCSIGTGDDCISIASGSFNIELKQVNCGPGHGISIGSLGKNKENASVEGIHVNGAIISGTSNGVRIKTWQGGSGYAKDIIFENVSLTNVTNPIIVDQYYCDSFQPCQNQTSAVQIQNITYNNIKGTAGGDGTSVKFLCSENVPCTEILMSDVNITSIINATVKSLCFNAFGSTSGTVIPASCLQQK